jgi:hypothetical protein
MTHVQDKRTFHVTKKSQKLFSSFKEKWDKYWKDWTRGDLLWPSHISTWCPQVHLIENHLCLLPPRFIIMKFYQFLNELKTWCDYHELDSNATQETQKKNQQRKPLAWKQQRLHETSLHKHWLDQWNFTWKLYMSWTLGSI